jgi:nucleoside triphosphate pyrophosphatase
MDQHTAETTTIDPAAATATGGVLNNGGENRRIILASQSPRRRQLLEWAELEFQVIIIPTDETFPEGMVTEEIPVHIACEKARAVRAALRSTDEHLQSASGSAAATGSRPAQITQELPKQAMQKVTQAITAETTAIAAATIEDASGDIIIAADTVVVLDNKIIGKPQSEQHAFEILSALSGRVHHVITGVCIWGREQIKFSDITSVEFHPLSAAEIWYYIKKYQPFDKAGAYGIQEWIGVAGIKGIRGDFYNVMGLPVSRVLQALKSGRL